MGQITSYTVGKPGEDLHEMFGSLSLPTKVTLQGIEMNFLTRAVKRLQMLIYLIIW